MLCTNLQSLYRLNHKEKYAEIKSVMKSWLIRINTLMGRRSYTKTLNFNQADLFVQIIFKS